MREELSSTFKKLQLSTGLIGESGENNFQNVSNNRLIEVHRLCKAYPAHRRLFSSQTKFHSVLNGVDLQINRAEIVGLAGASVMAKQPWHDFFWVWKRRKKALFQLKERIFFPGGKSTVPA